MNPYEKLARDVLDVKRENDDELICLCPFHDDSNASLWVNKRTGYFICFACNAKGGPKALARWSQNTLSPETSDDMLVDLLRKLDVLEGKNKKCSCGDTYAQALAGAGEVTSPGYLESLQVLLGTQGKEDVSTSSFGSITRVSGIPGTSTTSTTTSTSSTTSTEEEMMKVGFISSSSSSSSNTPPYSPPKDDHRTLSTGTEPGVCETCGRPYLLTENYLKRFLRPTGYWTEDRGFTPQIVNLFGLGFDPITRCGTIPYRTSSGLLLGVFKRNTRKSTSIRYLYPKKFPRKSTLFGSWLLPHALGGVEDVLPPGWVVMVEGSTDAMKVWQAGLPAVAMLGSSLSPQQVMILKRLGVRGVTFFPDAKGGGKKGPGPGDVRDQALGLLADEGFLTRTCTYKASWIASGLDDPGALPPDLIRSRVARSRGWA